MSVCSVAIKLIYLTNLHDECASVNFLHCDLSDICVLVPMIVIMVMVAK